MTTKKNKIELKRVNMNLPADLVQKVIEYGEKLGLNTTSAYIVLLNQALEQKETLNNMPAILEFISCFRESQINNIDDTKED